ncbi:MAG: condensation domain-containing protein, partial [Blastocatellia bacterium]
MRDTLSRSDGEGEDVYIFPASFAQQRLWYLAQLDPDSTVYNNPAAWRLIGKLEVAALEQSFSEVVRRHEVLRTTFATIEGKPVQIVNPRLGLTLQIADIRGSDAEDGETALRSRALEDAGRPFDLACGPLLRVSLLRLAGESHALLLTTHHIIRDAWSMNVLTREVVSLYEAYIAGRPSPLPELSIQYADYA